jgi:hypothetical protein
MVAHAPTFMSFIPVSARERNIREKHTFSFIGDA